MIKLFQKKLLYGLAGLFLAVIIANAAINYWIKIQLPNLILENNKTSYKITYKSIEFSLWSRNIEAKKIIIHPKNGPTDSKRKMGIYANISAITIKHFNIWNLLIKDEIKAHSVLLNGAQVIIYKNTQSKSSTKQRITNNVLEPFHKLISVKNIYLDHSKIDVVAMNTLTPILSIKNITFKLENFSLTPETLKKSFPISFKNYTLICDSLYYKPNPFYHLTTKKISTQNNYLKLTEFEFVPDLTRSEFIKNLVTEKDIYTIKFDSASVHKLDWGQKNDRLFINANALNISQLDANIYRNKLPKDDLSKKLLYNSLLRKLKFPLQIDTLNLKNSKVVYQEEINFSKGPATLVFDQFNLKATDIHSGFGQKKVPDLAINVRCRFMKTSPLIVNWQFNPLDKTDAFRISGSIKDLDTQKMSGFTKSLVNASVSGLFKNYRFSFYGNDTMCKGNASLEYENLKVSIYKKDQQKKSKLKSALANMFIKNDSESKSKSAEVAVERIPEKSFYNLLWRTIAASLKDIVL